MVLDQVIAHQLRHDVCDAFKDCLSTGIGKMGYLSIKQDRYHNSQNLQTDQIKNAVCFKLKNRKLFNFSTCDMTTSLFLGLANVNRVENGIGSAS